MTKTPSESLHSAQCSASASPTSRSFWRQAGHEEASDGCCRLALYMLAVSTRRYPQRKAARTAPLPRALHHHVRHRCGILVAAHYLQALPWSLKVPRPMTGRRRPSLSKRLCCMAQRRGWQQRFLLTAACAAKRVRGDCFEHALKLCSAAAAAAAAHQGAATPSEWCKAAAGGPALVFFVAIFRCF